jgi:hypothetical protein
LRVHQVVHAHFGIDSFSWGQRQCKK